MVKMHKIKWRKAKKFYCVVDLYWQTGLKDFIIEHNIDFKENVYCNENTIKKIWQELCEVYSKYDIIQDKKIYGNKKYKKKRKSKIGSLSIDQINFIKEDYNAFKPKIDSELKDDCIKIVY